ncbi:MAG: TraR/DksA family transcriptional regulator [Endomicrobiia bacterium]
MKKKKTVKKIDKFRKLRKKEVKETSSRKLKISKKDLDFYKKKLLEKYNEILKLQKNNNIELPLEIGDEIDIAEHNLGKEVRRELSDTQINLLNLINIALEKIEKGEYGFCSKCGKKIPKKRLNALPWTDLCIKCQKINEMS